MFKAKRRSSGSASGKDSSTATPKLVLPPVLTEEYIQTAFTILLRRESIRRDQSDTLPDDDEPVQAAYCASVGMHPYNARCNRYVDVVPYDWSRVVIPLPSTFDLGSKSGSDGTSNPSSYGSTVGASYINASWVRELCGGKWTVATQAPLEKTAHAFLSMLLLPVSPPHFGPEHASATTSGSSHSQDLPIPPPPAANRLRTIIQLTPNVEGRLKKAFQYFPKEIGQEIIWQPQTRASHPLMDGGSSGGVEIPHHPPISVTLLDAIPSKHEEPIWVQSILQVSFVGSTEPGHIVRHLHYLVSLTFPT